MEDRSMWQRGEEFKALCQHVHETIESLNCYCDIRGYNLMLIDGNPHLCDDVGCYECHKWEDLEV